MMSPGSAIAIGLAAVSLALYVACVVLCLHTVRRRGAPRAAGAHAQPPVSILKPCAGSDDEFEENLASFFALRYPRYEIVFGLADVADPALAVIERARRMYPHVATRVVICDEQRHANPKVASLDAMAARARHAVLWVSDSNTRVHPDTLAAMVDALHAPGTGAVVSPVIGDGERTPGALLDSLHVTAYMAMTTWVVHRLFGRIAAPGKSWMLRRATLERVGGWRAIGATLAEDTALFARLHAHGLRPALGPHAVASVNVAGTVEAFFQRHLRWAQIRWRLTPGTVVFDVLLLPFVVTLAAFALAPGVATLALLALGTLAQLAGDAALMRALRGRPLSPGALPWVLARALLVPCYWLTALVRRRLVWRGRRFRVGWGAVPIAEPAAEPGARVTQPVIVR